MWVSAGARPRQLHHPLEPDDPADEAEDSGPGRDAEPCPYLSARVTPHVLRIEPCCRVDSVDRAAGQHPPP